MNHCHIILLLIILFTSCSSDKDISVCKQEFDEGTKISRDSNIYWVVDSARIRLEMDYEYLVVHFEKLEQNYFIKFATLGWMRSNHTGNCFFEIPGDFVWFVFSESRRFVGSSGYPSIDGVQKEIFQNYKWFKKDDFL
jgi:hypothetical protein